MRTFLKVLGIIGIVLLVLVVVAATWFAWTVRRSWPQTSGTIDVPGLSASVEVVRDSRGVPDIYADTPADLFFAQGYVHAQDRFWEMDFRRHITSGRLSEMFGKSQVDTDAFIRTLGWRRVAEQEYGMLSERSRATLQSYADGVNAYLKDHAGATLSLEYVILGLNNSSYTVEPWDPVDSVAWLKALAWDLHGNEDDEVDRVLTSSVVGIDRTEQLYPPYPYDTHQPIVTSGAVVDGAFDPGATATQTDTAALRIPADAIPVLQRVSEATSLLDDVLGPRGEGIGSNSWVISGDLTDTGKPLLANDPHLAPMMPSLWYQAGLHCRNVSADCPFEVSGWTMAVMPGVFIGHNQDIAWGFTNLGPDVSDLVLEKVEGDTYLVDGEQRPMTTREEVIKVAGGDPVTITVRETEHGPLVSDVAEAGDDYVVVGQEAPVPAPGETPPDEVPDRGDGYAVALRWTALTPETTFDAFDAISTATGWDDFRKAAALAAVPSQNLVYADVDGNIGYQAPGKIPIRRGYDGKWPVPGWSSQYDWDGYIPFEALPYAYNPDEGWIVTANQAAVYPDYAYFLTDDWSYGARSQRIVDRVVAATSDGRKMTSQEMSAIQFDAWNEIAAFLTDDLVALAAGTSAEDAAALFEGWDHQQQVDSAPGAYFNAFWRSLMTRMFDSTLSRAGVESNRGDRFFQVVMDLWDEPNDPWWQDGTDPANTDRDATVRAALESAAQELRDAQGDDPTGWRWGVMHTLELENQSLGKSGIGPIEWLFNRGPVEVGGGGSIVQATGWSPPDGYAVDWVPSMRQVVDLADLDRSTWVNLTGASGHAFNPNYNDQNEAWRTGEHFPWPFTRSAVDAAAQERLTLQPPQQ
ncbi:MAG: penicillin acylase family protein [Candidatus Nanopelagicales bacterium]